MRISAHNDILRLERIYTISFSDFELVTLNLPDRIRELLHRAENSKSISDKIAALAVMAKMLEEQAMQDATRLPTGEGA